MRSGRLWPDLPFQDDASAVHKSEFANGVWRFDQVVHPTRQLWYVCARSYHSDLTPSDVPHNGMQVGI